MPEPVPAHDPDQLARYLAGELGDRVRELRIRRGWSTEDLGRRPGLTGGTVRDIEAKNKHMRRLNTLVALALALDLDSLDELFAPGVTPTSGIFEDHWQRHRKT